MRPASGAAKQEANGPSIEAAADRSTQDRACAARPDARRLSLPRRPKAPPFHASLDTPLLDFGGERWRIRDACEGICIVGAPGSGKTSASAKAIRNAALRAGMGGLFLCAKIDEAQSLIADIRKAGRADDLIVIDAAAEQRFNILDYAAQHLGGPGFEQNLCVMMERMNEATRTASPKGKGGDSGDNNFFVDGASKWLSHAFPLLLAAEGGIRLEDVYRFITTAPKSAAELATAEWLNGYCSAVHKRAYQKAMAGDSYAARVINEHGSFFLEGEFVILDNRPRSSIEATLTNLIYPFLSGKLRELFCTDTTVTPEATRDGALIVMDLPPVKYGPTGAVAQTIFKYLFGMVSQNEKVTAATRPVLLYMDECQNFLSSADADLLAMARSSKICPVFITQDYPTFFAKMGEHDAKSLLGKFGTRIFHANTSHDTNLAASEIIGKVQKFHVGRTQGTAINTGRGGNQGDLQSGFQGNTGKSTNSGESSSGYLDYEIPPDQFRDETAHRQPRATATKWTAS